MAVNPSGQGFQNKNRVAILAELDKAKRKSLMQNQSSPNHPGASMPCSRLMHIHPDTSQLKTLHLGILFFQFYFPLTQNEENICDESDFVIPNAKAAIIQCYTNSDFQSFSEL
ncbi:uncharacterized protein LOC111727654 isoform X1 [Otolemur garnettii]|uniref:uncharacterized protein LOC111727654 isoform X1 n=1 Tax=Otolemur garnettii TaxID=30611 RepID=UPI000C7F0674|nr:uncharacterized protein LOC111727654 isoform X1 [Otolemur garnettii]